MSLYAVIIILGEDDIGVYVCNNSHGESKVAITGAYLTVFCFPIFKIYT